MKHTCRVVWCSVLQCVAVRQLFCCSTAQHTATHWNTLQHSATHCNTLQHIATHCNTLQRTATHCNTHWRLIARMEWSTPICCSHTWTYLWGTHMTHIWRYQWVTHMTHTCEHTCEGLSWMSRVACIIDSHASVCHVTHRTRRVYVSCQTHECVMSHTYMRREVGGWGRDPKKCTGRDWGMGSSTI